MKNKKLFYGILVAVLLVIGIIISTTLNKQKTTLEINNFDDCARAGYPILESYPRQCKTPDGKTFTEIIPLIEPEPIGPDTEVFTDPTEPEEDFCGRSSYGKCLTDLNCITGGCSKEVCQSKDEEPVITTCVFKECYNVEKYSRQCKCVNEQCQWYEYPRE